MILKIEVEDNKTRMFVDPDLRETESVTLLQICMKIRSNFNEHKTKYKNKFLLICLKENF